VKELYPRREKERKKEGKKRTAACAQHANRIYHCFLSVCSLEEGEKKKKRRFDYGSLMTTEERKEKEKRKEDFAGYTGTRVREDT